MTVRLAADIGGTFTDLVLLDDAGELHVHKTPSTPRDFTEGILTGVDRIVSEHGEGDDLDGVDTFVHGATVVLNALLQARLPATGLITTAGFRDVLEIMRTNNPEMYDLGYLKPRPLVPRALRFEVRGRMRSPSACSTPMPTRPTSAGSRRSWPRNCPPAPSASPPTWHPSGASSSARRPRA
jgi:N-methylhydantoinase A